LIYKCGGIDKRTIEKFEKVRYIPYILALMRKTFCLSLLALRSLKGQLVVGGVFYSAWRPCGCARHHHHYYAFPQQHRCTR